MTTAYRIGAESHPGQMRGLNEDSYGTPASQRVSADRLARHGHLFAVADGMGGHAAGEVASRLAIAALFEAYYQASGASAGEALREAVREANRRVYEQATSEEGRQGMGTTLVAAVVQRDRAVVANVGDSRAYLVRRGQATQLTQDHSWVAEQIRAGIINEEEARRHTYRSVITRAVGHKPDVEVDLFQHRLRPGDSLLLCSDGLSGVLRKAHIAQTVSGSAPSGAAQALVQLANQAGGPDNITAVVVQPEDTQRRRERLVPLAMVGAVALLALAVFVGWTLFQAAAERRAAATATPIATQIASLPTALPTKTAFPATASATPTPRPTDTPPPSPTPSPTPLPPPPVVHAPQIGPVVYRLTGSDLAFLATPRPHSAEELPPAELLIGRLAFRFVKICPPADGSRPEPCTPVQDVQETYRLFRDSNKALLALSREELIGQEISLPVRELGYLLCWGGRVTALPRPEGDSIRFSLDWQPEGSGPPEQAEVEFAPRDPGLTAALREGQWVTVLGNSRGTPDQRPIQAMALVQRASQDALPVVEPDTGFPPTGSGPGQPLIWVYGSLGDASLRGLLPGEELETTGNLALVGLEWDEAGHSFALARFPWRTSGSRALFAWDEQRAVYYLPE